MTDLRKFRFKNIIKKMNTSDDDINLMSPEITVRGKTVNRIQDSDTDDDLPGRISSLNPDRIINSDPVKRESKINHLMESSPLNDIKASDFGDMKILDDSTQKLMENSESIFEIQTQRVSTNTESNRHRDPNQSPIDDEFFEKATQNFSVRNKDYQDSETDDDLFSCSTQMYQTSPSTNLEEAETQVVPGKTNSSPKSDTNKQNNYNLESETLKNNFRNTSVGSKSSKKMIPTKADCEFTPGETNIEESETDDEGIFQNHRVARLNTEFNDRKETLKDNFRNTSVESKSLRKMIPTKTGCEFTSGKTNIEDSETDDEGIFQNCRVAPLNTEFNDRKETLKDNFRNTSVGTKSSRRMIPTKTGCEFTSSKTNIEDSETDDEGIFQNCRVAPLNTEFNDRKETLKDNFRNTSVGTKSSRRMIPTKSDCEFTPGKINIEDSETDDEGISHNCRVGPLNLELSDKKETLKNKFRNTSVRSKSLKKIIPTKTGCEFTSDKTNIEDSETDDEDISQNCRVAPLISELSDKKETLKNKFRNTSVGSKSLKKMIPTKSDCEFTPGKLNIENSETHDEVTLQNRSVEPLNAEFNGRKKRNAKKMNALTTNNRYSVSKLKSTTRKSSQRYRKLDSSKSIAETTTICNLHTDNETKKEKHSGGKVSKYRKSKMNTDRITAQNSGNYIIEDPRSNLESESINIKKIIRTDSKRKNEIETAVPSKEIELQESHLESPKPKRSRRLKGTNENNSSNADARVDVQEARLSGKEQKGFKSKRVNGERGKKRKTRDGSVSLVVEAVALSTTTLTETSLDRGSSFAVSFSKPKRSKSIQLRYKVLFTGLTSTENYQKHISKLGLTTAKNVDECTILVTDKVRRTFKFLCALSRGIPIVSVAWMTDSLDKHQIQDFKDYLIKDEAAEAQFGFTLEESLRKAHEGKMLEGYIVILPPTIAKPPISELKGMVQASGGKAILRPPVVCNEKTVILSDVKNLDKAKRMLKRVPEYVKIHSIEFLLTGILKQRVDLNSYLLDIQH